MKSTDLIPQRYISVRELAAKLGISKGTVSLALNDSPRVKASTVKKVKAAAAAAGYQKNTMVSTMMSSMRKSAIGGFRETIALLNGNTSRDAFKTHPTLPIYKEGILREAAALGFKVDEFWLCDPALTRKKLSAILHARGIRGGIVMGHTENGVFESYSKIWSDFKIVSAGISVHNPAYELVSSNQFEVARGAVANLIKMGFRRIAFIVDKRIDDMVDGRFYGGFFSARYELPAECRIDPFTENIESPTYFKNLADYIESNEPEVVIYMLGQTGDFIYQSLRRKNGTRYPIVQLERRSDTVVPKQKWSGMEQHNDRVGGFSVRRLAALLSMATAHNHSPTTLIPPTWEVSPWLKKEADALKTARTQKNRQK